MVTFFVILLDFESLATELFWLVLKIDLIELNMIKGKASALIINNQKIKTLSLGRIGG
jgi:hypothetical protein